MSTPPTPSGRSFWFGAAIGGAIVAFGIAGLLTTQPFSAARDIAVWVVTADVIHDLILAPVIVLTSVALTRVVPLPWRAPIRAALATSALLTLIAYPALRGTGHDTAPGNTTVQPLDYTTALFTVLGIVWALALLWIAGIAIDPRHGNGENATRA